MKIRGSVLSRLSSITLSTADDKQYSLENSFLVKTGLLLIGLPHLGFRARARIISSFLSEAPRTARILDAGAGFGIYTLSLAQAGYSIDAVEIDNSRIAALAKASADVSFFKGHIRIIHGSLTSLHLPSNFYDVIICSDVIEHIADHEAAIAELSRVLNLDGTLLLTVPYDSRHNCKIYKMFGHERPGYSYHQMEDLVKSHGLKIVETRVYETYLGSILFSIFNKLQSPILMALFFFPFYALYLLDMKFPIGEPNGIAFRIKKI